MNSENYHRRRLAKSCKLKKRYHDHDDAIVVAQSAKQRGVKLRAYECAGCGGWHLTKTP